jgi:hypothetical protein
VLTVNNNPRMKNGKKSVSVLLPFGALLCSALLPILLALRVYFRLKTAAHGAARVSFGSAALRFTIPTEHLLSFAFSGTGLWAGEPIRAINAPAMLVDLFVSFIFSGNGHPESILTSTWVILAFPIYALPAWWFVGRGFDGLLNRKRIRVVEMVIGAVLATSFLALAAMTRFGMSAAERGGQAGWYMYGFTFWGLLFAVPFVAWIRQRTRGESMA